MKTGVITFYRYNYGGFLQAYALQKVLRSMDYDAELLRYDYMNDIARYGGIKRLLTAPLAYVRSVAGNEWNMFKKLAFHHVMAVSARANLRESRRYSSLRKLLSEKHDYELCITGSDQVLNPSIHPVGLPLRLQEFRAMPGMIKVTYAASIGRPDLSNDEIARLGLGLRDFSALSAREEQSAGLLRQLGFANIPIHLDPVFLIGLKEWQNFAKEPRGIAKPFIFTHQLEEQADMITYVNRLSQELSMPVVSSDARSIYHNCKHYLRPLSPEEFVWCILNARYVVTNSFHGTALSVQLERPVRVFLPATAPVRIEELLESCALEWLLSDKPIQEGSLEKLYEFKREKIAQEKEKAFGYLRALRELKK